MGIGLSALGPQFGSSMWTLVNAQATPVGWGKTRAKRFRRPDDKMGTSSTIPKIPPLRKKDPRRMTDNHTWRGAR
jgi:hypothetical protein